MTDFNEVLPAEASRELAEEMIVAWRAKRAARLASEKVVEGLKKEETAMKSWLISVFRDQVLEGMLIEGRLTGVSEREVHVVEDKMAFTQYILDNKALELLQFRISDSAIFDRETNGEDVPGVSLQTVYDLFDRKG